MVNYRYAEPLHAPAQYHHHHSDWEDALQVEGFAVCGFVHTFPLCSMVSVARTRRTGGGGGVHEARGLGFGALGFAVHEAPEGGGGVRGPLLPTYPGPLPSPVS